ncbi:MAG: radical SAM protein, partial [Thiohalocapsa sp.]
GDNLCGLLKRVLAETDVPRIRLGSLEPWDLPDDFWPLFDNPRLMPHLHLPLQSGADSVLRRMARRCKTGEFARLVNAGRAALPALNVTTDIIVGFPGESDDEWRRTMDFAEQIGFGHLHIFAYSPRAGTRAATMPDQVPNAVKQARSRQLHELGLRMKGAMLARQIGHEVPLLLEGIASDGQGAFRAAYTPNYLQTRLRNPDKTQINQILTARLAGITACGEALDAVPKQLKPVHSLSR